MTPYQIFEIVSLTLLVAILIFDLLLVIKRPHVPSMKESTAWVVFYVSLALVFGGALFAIGDPGHGVDFLTGWALEYSLSIDNLFVFIIIISRFAVPKELQQRVLMIGILIAIVLRGIFILVGVQLVEQFTWLFYIFGAYLIFVAWRQAFGGEDDAGEKDNVIVRLLKRRVNVTDTYDGGKLRTRIDGARYFTPMLMVLVALGSTDLLFAIDSIPAIFEVTTDPFLVLACNIFALMGLRQLYFLLGGLLERLVYLHYGIAFILGFIGIKLVMHAMHENTLPFINGGEHIDWVPDIGNVVSLIVILASMTIATVASLIKIRVDGQRSGDTSLHLGPADAELGDDGHYHLVSQAGTSFARPVRIEPRTQGLQVIDADGQRASITDFDRDALRTAATEDMDTGSLQAIRDEAVAEFEALDHERAAAAEAVVADPDAADPEAVDQPSDSGSTDADPTTAQEPDGSR